MKEEGHAKEETIETTETTETTKITIVALNLVAEAVAHEMVNGPNENLVENGT
jgi:hypothetical protein